jgi:replicative DNA helicase
LGAFLRRPKTLSLVHDLHDDDFTDDAARLVFRSIRSLISQNAAVDAAAVASVAEKLGGHKAFEYALDAATEYSRAFITEAAVPQHIAELKTLTARRRMIDIMNGGISDVLDPKTDTLSALERIRQALSSVVQTKGTASTIGDVLLETHSYLSRLATGEIKPISTGIPSLDTALGGVFPGEMTVIGARPSVGKSAVALNMALKAALSGKHVVFVSCEMNAVQFGQRIISHGSNVPGMKLRTGNIDADAWDGIADAMTRYGNLPLKFLFDTLTIEDICLEARTLHERGELDILIVDYLQLVKSKASYEKDFLRVSAISRELKELSRKLDIPVIALAQVARSAQGKMPTLGELRSSGDIEQDADGVVFIHRPADMHDESVHPMDKDNFEYVTVGGLLQYICFGVAKQRQGMVGIAHAIFDPAHMRYTTIERRMNA